MTKHKFADEFKQEAVRQVVERGYRVSDVAKRPGVSVQSLYKWVKEYSPNELISELRKGDSLRKEA